MYNSNPNESINSHANNFEASHEDRESACTLLKVTELLVFD